MVSEKPRLNYSALAPDLRFEPMTRWQHLDAVYVLWNVLDISLARTYGWNGGTYQRYTTRPSTPYGYMREVQLHAYTQLVWHKPAVRAYCEVGFNGGHGTVAILLASPQLHVHSFELGQFPYTHTAQEMVRAYFGDRFHTHNGDSKRIVPAFAEKLRTKHGRSDVCDIVLVDGDHSTEGTISDVLNFRKLARCNATLLIDDLNEGPGAALKSLEQRGIIEVLERHTYDLATSPHTNCVRCFKTVKGTHEAPCKNGLRCFERWGWAIAKYVNGPACEQSANDAGARESLVAAAAVMAERNAGRQWCNGPSWRSAKGGEHCTRPLMGRAPPRKKKPDMEVPNERPGLGVMSV